MKNYDVIVIGSGPGGYVCAIRCAQLGFKTAIIERYKTLGGTCLNVGCIPSKALLDSSEHFHNATHHFKTHGIQVENLGLDFGQMLSRKNTVVSDTCQGVAYLMKKNQIDVYEGHGRFASAQEVEVLPKEGGEILARLQGKYIVIATGSKPIAPPAFNYDKKRIITSTEALNLPEVPKRMLVIGGGVIGLELGSVYARLGAEVEVVEYGDSLLNGMDKDLAREMQKVLRQQLKMKFHLSHEVLKVENQGEAVFLEAKARKDGKLLQLQGDYCLISIGRHAYTQGLQLDKAGVISDERGRIVVDNHLRSSVPHIFAIGDVVRGAMLAHKAEEEGVLVAEQLAGQKPHIDYNLIPGIVYTWPEVASVGQTEEQLREANLPFKVGKFHFKALGRARASGDTDGFVKILAHKETDEVLGMHIIGARAADLIMEGVTAMEFRASAEDIARFSHGHPTFSEAIKEAALAATDNRALHT